jgi:dsDNA-specific endonuclease/ATPase MutS2
MNNNSKLSLTHEKKIQSHDDNAFKNKVVVTFRRFCEKDGHVNESYDPHLFNVSSQIRSSEDKIKKVLQSFITRSDISSKLQVQSFDFIYDHYVLAIKSEFYHPQLGRIIYRSESGHTFFVEPYEISQLSQKIIELKSEREQILNQICQRFCHLIAHYNLEVRSTVNYLLQLDMFMAKTNFCQRLKHNRPSFNTKDLGFTI